MLKEYIGKVIEIADVFPSRNIDFAHKTFLTIKCRYDIKNFIQFFLVRNHSEVVVQMDYLLKTGNFVIVTRRKGFHCTPPISPIMRSFMKKLEFLNPPAKVNKLAIFRCSAYIGAPFGATDFLWIHETKHQMWINVSQVHVRPYGKCLSPAVSIKKIVIREGDIGNSSVSCSVHRISRTLQLTNITGTEQKAIRDNADKLSGANIITKILKFAATLLVIGHFH
ncbi:Hypothetical predicted protein [Octopus vulgaris]|uniref:Uncharacterized protein n=1 Tax=Octopus vulgaris TaxID=6645 RepID=A0AA36BQB0_OCTVU|nr:Hypothetical predicted protein [Octopus vulgaris]